jgi:hypothetical protein
MQLRQKLGPAWPPQWGGAYQGAQRLPAGEDAGVLVEVRREHSVTTGEAVLVLVTEYEGSQWAGPLPVQDPELRERVYELLRANIGRSIGEIGALPLDDC